MALEVKLECVPPLLANKTSQNFERCTNVACLRRTLLKKFVEPDGGALDQLVIVAAAEPAVSADDDQRDGLNFAVLHQRVGRRVRARFSGRKQKA